METKFWTTAYKNTAWKNNWVKYTWFWWRSSPLLGYISLVQLHSLGLCISLNCEKVLFIVSCCFCNLLQSLQNIKIYQEWLFLSQNWSKIASVMVKPIFPTISPLKLEVSQTGPLKLVLRHIWQALLSLPLSQLLINLR